MQGCIPTQPIWSIFLKPGAFLTQRSGSFKNMQKQQSHLDAEQNRRGWEHLERVVLARFHSKSGNIVDCLQSELNQPPPHPNKLACAFFWWLNKIESSLPDASCNSCWYAHIQAHPRWQTLGLLLLDNEKEKEEEGAALTENLLENF